MIPNEVRIGNWVLIPANNEIKIPCFPKKIKAITLFGEFDFTEPTYPENHLVAAKHCAGIPIDEDWLKKLGFKHKSGNEYVLGNFIYRKIQRNLVVNGYEHDYNGILLNLEYVHQIQNIYYSIIGEELPEAAA